MLSNEIDPQIIANAKSSIIKMRRLYHRCFLAFIIIFTTLIYTITQFESYRQSLLYSIIVLSMILILFTTWSVGVIAMILLWRFRCPRCGKRSDHPGINGLPREICHHCYLKLG